MTADPQLPPLERLRQFLERAGANLHAIDQAAGFARRMRLPPDLVIEAYRNYLEHDPTSATAAFNLAWNLARDAQSEAAVAMYERALELGISEPEEVHLNIANVYMEQMHAHGEARNHLRQALSLNPRYASAWYNLGNLCEQEGERDEARRSFERCLELDPGNESGLARLAETRVFEAPDDPLLQRLVTVANSSDNSDVHFALGQAYERLGNFEGAWRHFARGNALDRQAMPPYRPAQAEAWFDAVAARCNKDWLDRFGGDSDEAVFICGMFRSGSTLLEQMLASHPRFVAGGESEFFPRLVAKAFPRYPEGLEDVAGASLQAWRDERATLLRRQFGEQSRITDKRPDNVRYLGLIKAVLPAARFVVTERDWRDIATSVYSVRLGPSQTYATKLEDIRHHIRLQTELVDHWEQVLGDDLVRIRYEDLAQDPQSTLTGLLEWLGESWDESCLSFHTLRNSVKTASVWQVRQPLHSKSVGRWKRYEERFIEALGASPAD